MITVLVVDDEPLVRLSVRSLEDWNAHHIDLAYEAGNGREALDLLGARPEIDVVLVDVDMPVMDGLEFAECLRERGGTQGLLFLSSFDTFNYARRAFKAGAGDYILKSEMDEGRLLAAVRKAARGRAEKAEGGGGAALQERKNELVGRLLAGSLADIGGVAGAPPFNVSFPARPVFLRAADTQLVRKRYGDDLPAFSRLTADLARQSLVSRRSGEAFSISFDRCLVLLDAAEGPEAFFEEFSRAALNYLDMVFDAGFSDPIDSWRGLRQAYRQAENRFSVSSRLVVRARRYIREHYADPRLGLADIAAYVEVSRNHLSGEFASETGETITACIARVRIEAAKQLLLHTNCKTYEIAEKVGYSNVETFCRVFKRITGTTPRGYAL